MKAIDSQEFLEGGKKEAQKIETVAAKYQFHHLPTWFFLCLRDESGKGFSEPMGELCPFGTTETENQ